MTKTPDEIKNGLECCARGDCHSCPYVDNCILSTADALALIRQLQAQNAEKDARIRQLEAERDAAVKDVKRYASCCRCKNLAKYGGKCFGGLRCEVKGDAREFEWLGVQKERTK